MRTVIAVMLMVVLVGCDGNIPVYRHDDAIRREVFTECMELAAKIGQGQAKYNDLSEVVESCQNSSYYMARKCVANCTQTPSQ